VGDVLGDFPDVPVRIGEARGPLAPVAIDGAAEQSHAEAFQVGNDRVDVIDPDRQHEPRSGAATGRRSGFDQVVACPLVQQVDQGVTEGEHRRTLVLIVDRSTEDVLVEGLRPTQIVDEQGDGADSPRNAAHAPTDSAMPAKSSP
jgi:hypothetical protein